MSHSLAPSAPLRALWVFIMCLLGQVVEEGAITHPWKVWLGAEVFVKHDDAEKCEHLA